MHVTRRRKEGRGPKHQGNREKVTERGRWGKERKPFRYMITEGDGVGWCSQRRGQKVLVKENRVTK